MARKNNKTQSNKFEEYTLTIKKYAFAAIIAVVANYLIASFGGGDGQKCYIPLPGLPNVSAALVGAMQCTPEEPEDNSVDIIEEQPQADYCGPAGGGCLPPQADYCGPAGGGCLIPRG